MGVGAGVGVGLRGDEGDDVGVSDVDGGEFEVLGDGKG